MSIKRGHAIENRGEEKKVAPRGSRRNCGDQQATTDRATGGAAAAAVVARRQVHRYDLDDETHDSPGCLSAGRFMERVFSSSPSSHVPRRARDPAMMMMMSSTRRHLPHPSRSHRIHLAHRHVWLLSLVALIVISSFSCQPSSARTVFGSANGGSPQLMLKLDGADLEDYALELANRNLVGECHNVTLTPSNARMLLPYIREF